MNIKPSLSNIFFEFLYIGTILLGGGYVVLPIIQNELVKKHEWITEDELIDFYALSQSLSGLIAINLSIFIGYKLKGIVGAILAVLGITFSAFWSIVLLSSLLFNPNIFPYFSFSFKCIEISVIVLIYLSIKEIWKKSVNDLYSSIIYLFSISLLLFFNISPVKLILISTIFGILLLSKKRESGVK